MVTITTRTRAVHSRSLLVNNFLLFARMEFESLSIAWSRHVGLNLFLFSIIFSSTLWMTNNAGRAMQYLLYTWSGYDVVVMLLLLRLRETTISKTFDFLHDIVSRSLSVLNYSSV